MPLARLVCPHCENPVEVNVTTVTRSRDCPACGRVIMLQFTTRTSRMKHRALLTHVTEMAETGSVSTMAAASAKQSLVGKAVSTGSKPAVSAPAKPVAPSRISVPAPAAQSTAPAPVKAAPQPVAAVADAATPLAAPPKPITSPVPVAPSDLPPVMPRVLNGDVRNRMEHDPEVKSSARALLLGLGIVVVLLAVVVLGKTQNWWGEAAQGWKALQTAYLRDDSAPKTDGAAAPAADAKAGDTGAAPVKAADWNREQDEALTSVKKFLAAKTVEERLKLVRDAAMLEGSMREYYSRTPDGPVAFTRVDLVEAEPQGMHSYQFAAVDARGARRNVLALRPDPGAPYVVDWGSFVLYSAMDWNQFMKDKPVKPVLFRLQAVPENHYNYNFLDSQRLLCLKLVNPVDKAAPPLYGYCIRTSTVGRTLDYLTKKNFGEQTAMIVKLRFPAPEESDSPNQVWIDEVVTEGWVARGY